MLKYAVKETIKNIITNEEMCPGDLEYDCQEFVVGRLEKLESNKIEELLELIGDNELINNLRDAILVKEYKCYNYGFLEGLKIVLTLEKT